jgi:putative chitinase
MLLTLEDLEYIYRKSSDKRRIRFLPHLNETLEKYEINTAFRKSCFLAQIGHESAELLYTRELASGLAYNNRSDLGNTQVEAKSIAKMKGVDVGVLYKGRGLIQITGFYNYKWLSKEFELDLIHFPEQLEQPKLAALSAGAFWNRLKLNTLADKQMFREITKAINGGYNGLEKRFELYDRCIERFVFGKE